MEKVSTKQAMALLIMALLGSSLLLNGAIKANQSSWLAILIAGIASLPMYLIYAKLLKLFPDKNLFEILEIVLGKKSGKVICVLYVLFAMLLCGLILREFSEFLSIVSLINTPKYVIELISVIFCIYLAKNGLGVMGRLSSIMIPGILVIIFFTGLLSAPEFNFRYITYAKPQPLSNIFDGSLSVLCFPFLEAALFLGIFRSFKTPNKTKKIFLTGLISCVIIILFTSLRNILLLGPPLQQMLYFPSYSAVSIGGIGDFFERIEVLVCIIFLLCGIVKTSAFLYFGAKGTQFLLKKRDYRPFVSPLGFLSVTVASLIITNTVNMFAWIDAYMYLSLPFFILFPVIIFIVCKVRAKSIGLSF